MLVHCTEYMIIIDSYRKLINDISILPIISPILFSAAPLYCEIFNKIWSRLYQLGHYRIDWLHLYRMIHKSFWSVLSLDDDWYYRRNTRFYYHDHSPMLRRESRIPLPRAVYSPSLSGAHQYQCSVMCWRCRYPLWWWHYPRLEHRSIWRNLDWRWSTRYHEFGNTLWPFHPVKRSCRSAYCRTVRRSNRYYRDILRWIDHRTVSADDRRKVHQLSVHSMIEQMLYDRVSNTVNRRDRVHTACYTVLFHSGWPHTRIPAAL